MVKYTYQVLKRVRTRYVQYHGTRVHMYVHVYTCTYVHGVPTYHVMSQRTYVRTHVYVPWYVLEYHNWYCCPAFAPSLNWLAAVYPPKTHVVLSALKCVPFSNQKLVVT